MTTSNEARVLERLRDHGFRITDPRREVVQAAYQQPGPFSAEELYDTLRDGGSGIGRATVFRTLDLLTNLRLLDRVHRPDGSHSYIAGGPGHRHHLICSTCGRVVDFPDCNVGDLIDELAGRTNFRIEGHWLEFFGVCDRCQRSAD